MTQGKTHVPTDEDRQKVKAASGFGLPHDRIAQLMNLSEKTLRRRYRAELNDGRATAHFNVAKTTYEQAVSGKNPTMTIWYEKTRMGMRETMQVATPPGEALVSAVGEPELLGAYFARLGRAGAAASGSAPGADSGADPGVGEDGQGADGSEGGEAPGEG